MSDNLYYEKVGHDEEGNTQTLRLIKTPDGKHLLSISDDRGSREIFVTLPDLLTLYNSHH